MYFSVYLPSIQEQYGQGQAAKTTPKPGDPDFIEPAEGQGKTYLQYTDEIPPTVQSRINLANGRTRFTPIRPKTGQPVSAGFDHVLDQYFNRPLANSRSVYSIQPNELKTILQSPNSVSSPVTAISGGQYVRVIDTGQVVGNTELKFGGNETTWIQVFTDQSGNLITSYPIPAPH